MLINFKTFFGPLTISGSGAIISFTNELEGDSWISNVSRFDVPEFVNWYLCRYGELPDLQQQCSIGDFGYWDRSGSYHIASDWRLKERAKLEADGTLQVIQQHPDHGLLPTNGFRSWAETHHEVVSAIAREMAKDQPCRTLASVYEAYGTAELYDMAIVWTNEFEKEFATESWDVLDFYEEIEAFMASKLV